MQPPTSSPLIRIPPSLSAPFFFFIQHPSFPHSASLFVSQHPFFDFRVLPLLYTSISIVPSPPLNIPPSFSTSFPPSPHPSVPLSCPLQYSSLPLNILLRSSRSSASLNTAPLSSSSASLPPSQHPSPYSFLSPFSPFNIASSSSTSTSIHASIHYFIPLRRPASAST